MRHVFLCLAAGLIFAERVPAQQSETVHVSYAITSQWGSGFSAELTIRNDASRAIEDWRFAFRLRPQITSIWNARIVSRNGQDYLIGPVDANWDDGELAAGESVKIGFVAKGAATEVPRSGYLNGAAIRFNESSPAPHPQRVRVVPASEWPRAAFAPYVDATTWPPVHLPSVAEDLNVRRFRLGFVIAQSATQANPTWGGAHSATSSYRLREINALRAAGGDIAIAFGGATGVELAGAARSAGELATLYQSVIDTYGVRVLDFDLEGAWLADGPSIQRRAEALMDIQERMRAKGRPLDIWFTLPVLPSGLTPEGVHVLRMAIEQGVDIRGVNAMAMNYGGAIVPQPAGRLGAVAIEAARSLHKQLIALYAAGGAAKEPAEVWQMIGITPMIGRNDVIAEVFQQRDANQLLAFAMQSRIGLLSFWSLNRDRTCEPPQAAANPLCSGITQHAYEFTRIFKPFDTLRE